MNLKLLFFITAFILLSFLIPAVNAEVADFIASPTSGAAPLTVQFTDASSMSNLMANGDCEADQPPGTSWWAAGGGRTTEAAYSDCYSLKIYYDPNAGYTPGEGDSFLSISGVSSIYSGVTLPQSMQVYWEAWVMSKNGGFLNNGYQYIQENGGAFRGVASTILIPSEFYLSPGKWYKIYGIGTTLPDWSLQSRLVLRPTHNTPGDPDSWNDANNPTYYDDIRVSYAGASASSMSWTFGDGATSTSFYPSHTYTSPGTYTVSLTATNSIGSDTETKNGIINVVSGVVSDFTMSSQGGDLPLQVQFTDASTGGTPNVFLYGDNEMYRADLGGGPASRTWTSTYAHGGSKSLGVRATSGSNTFAVMGPIQVPPSTMVKWEAWAMCPDGAYMPSTYLQDETPSGWQNYGGNSGNVYLPPGTWVKIGGTATSPANCYKTSHIIVCGSMFSNWSGWDTSKTIYYDDFKVTLGSGTSSADTWLWAFGDVATSNLQNPSHTYTTPGFYDVTLTAYMKSGNSNNLVDNPGIETTVPKIQQAVNVNYGRTSSYAHNGSYSLSEQATTSAAWSAWLCEGNYYVPPNTPVYVEEWVYSPTTTYILTPYLQESGGQWRAPTGMPIYFTQITGGIWTKLTATGVTPSDWLGTDRLVTSVAFNLDGTPRTDVTIYHDDLMVSIPMAVDTVTKSRYISVGIVNFTALPTSGNAPLTVQFTDLTGANLLTQAQSECGESGSTNGFYVGYGSATITSNSSQSWEGTYSIKIVSTGTSQFSLSHTQNVPATAGTYYVGSAYVKSTNPADSVYPVFWCYDSSGNVLGNIGGQLVTVNNTGWTRVSTTPATPLANTASIRLEFYSGSIGIGVGYYFDGMMVDRSSSLRPWTIGGVTQPIAWSWNFGDGATNNDSQNPVHVYDSGGPYTVTLTVSNGVWSSSLQRVSYITVIPTPDLSISSGDITFERVV